MKAARTILIVSGLGVIAFAVYRYYKMQVSFLKDIQYKLAGIRIVSIAADRVSIDITSTIYNTSNVEATVKEMYLNFFLNNTLVGNITEVKDIVILPAKSTDVTFRFNFSPKLVLGNIVNLLTFTATVRDMTYKVKGYVRIKSSFIGATVPFEYENTLKTVLKS